MSVILVKIKQSKTCFVVRKCFNENNVLLDKK